MLIGVPKEIKDNEYRVGLVPSTVRELTDKGHQVLIEAAAARAPASPTPTIEPPAPKSSRRPTPSSAAPT